MKPLVLQSDFGLSDGAVSAMYGVANSVSNQLKIYNLTHDITPYDIWEGSYRLIQTITYWQKGTVFVSVVDPGVGSDRTSVVAKTNGDHYIVTPNNGTLTHVKRIAGIKEVRIIDEEVNRLPNSGESYTFHGRDVYAYTGARLASGEISFDQVGPLYNLDDVVMLPITEPVVSSDFACGTIDVLDIRFGSLWTNISREMVVSIGLKYGDRVEIKIENDTRAVYRNVMTYSQSFAGVYVGEPLMYINSLDCVAIAINQGSFSKAYNIGTGNSWHITISKSKI